MPKSRLLVIACVCSLVAMPTKSNAQASDSTKAKAQDFAQEVLKGILGPNWNVFAHGGFATGDRYLLQQALDPTNGEQALKSSTGFGIGGGVGVDILPRMGLRVSYTFTSNDLNFRTDNGDGSEALDIDDVGALKSHTAGIEVLRYMLPTRAVINPYGTLGIQGTWWTLDEQSPLVTSSGASTPFSVGPLFSFGVQFKASDKWSGRAEATFASKHNPFSGNKSFRALGGPAIDEPTSINRSDFRVAGVYHFGKPKMPPSPVAQR